MQFDRKVQEQQGLGLGLTIAKRLTELHGGTLSIQSEQGKSTTVLIKLPKIVLNGDTPKPSAGLSPLKSAASEMV
jgi:signal transduction histidine kinase